MNNNMITSVDKFNRTSSTSKHTNVANNKIEVALDRFPNIKGTEVEKVLKTFANIMEEADRHIAENDNYFDYLDDRTNSYARLNLMITMIYKAEGNIDKIKKDICFRNAKAEATELSDHYWAF